MVSMSETTLVTNDPIGVVKITLLEMNDFW